MSIMEKLFGKNRAIPSTAMFRITEEGRDKLQEFNGDAESRVLVALETRGSSNIETIANVSRVQRGQVERIVPRLVGQGKIQYVNSNAGEE
jgi:hypothetical protein